MSATPWFDEYCAAREDRLGALRDPRIGVTLYCITEDSGLPIKVGISKRPGARTGTLMAMTWRPLKLCWKHPANGHHEAAIKHILVDRNIQGEWFEDKYDEIKLLGLRGLNPSEMIEDLAEHFGFPPVVYPRRPRPPRLELAQWVKDNRGAAA